MRLLKAAVYIMGVLLVAGTIFLIVAIAWRAAQLPAAGGRGFAELAVGVGRGAVVTSMELAGDRLAVAVEAEGGPEIIVIDVRRGAVVGRVRLKAGGGSSPGD